MSFDDCLTIWVGDLDEYITLNFKEEESDPYEDPYEQEKIAQKLEFELEELGEIELFSGISISARTLNAKGISPKEWRWALHKAEGRIKKSGIRLVGEEYDFVKNLLSLGRGYAVSRYAKLEKISYLTALTATFQNGLRALLDQFLRGQKIIENVEQFRAFEALIRADITCPKFRILDDQTTAYSKTSNIQTAIHKCAIEAHGHNGHLKLDKEAMRCMLSLIRLHFLFREMDVANFRKIHDLYNRYTDARLAAIDAMGTQTPVRGKQIKNWKLRHLHPLTHFYPFSIRNSISRGLAHFSSDTQNPSREVLINELALAHCGLDLMKKRAIEKTKESRPRS